jgi:hypothetical protein
MRKLKYILLLTVSIVFIESCTQKSQIAGPAGAAGATGLQGGGFQGLVDESFQLSNTSVVYGTAPSMFAWTPYIDDPNNPNDTYMLTVYASKLGSKLWTKLPWAGVFQGQTDELYCTLSHDSVKIFYYNTISNFPDSIINTRIIIVPNQQ